MRPRRITGRLTRVLHRWALGATLGMVLFAGPLGVEVHAAAPAATPLDPRIAREGPNLSVELAPLDVERRAQIAVGDIDPVRAARLRGYYASGAARRDQEALARRARSALTSWSATSCPEGLVACRGTVVLDIDDTVLDSSAFYASTDPPFTADSRGWAAFRDGCRQQAIPAVRALMRALHDDAWRVVIVTGRSEANRRQTLACLRKRGIVGWDELVMRSSTDANVSATRWKARQRQRLEDQGWLVVASIGDQLSDMSEGPMLMGFLMPNPMYAIS